MITRGSSFIRLTVLVLAGMWLAACKASESTAAFEAQINRVAATASVVGSTKNKAARTEAYWNTAAAYVKLLEDEKSRQGGNIRRVGLVLQEIPAAGVDEEAVRAVLQAAGALNQTAHWVDFGQAQSTVKSMAAGGAAGLSGSASAYGAAASQAVTSGAEGPADIMQVLEKTDADVAIARGVLTARYSREFRRIHIAYFRQ